MAGLWDVLVGAAGGASGQIQAQQEQARKLQQIMMMHAAAQMYPSAEERMNRLLFEQMQQEQTQQQSMAKAQAAQRALELNPPPSPVTPMVSFPAITEQGAGMVMGRPSTNEGYPAAIASLPGDALSAPATPNSGSLSMLQMMLRHKFGLPLPSAMLEEEARAKAAGTAAGNPLLATELSQKEAQTELETTQAQRARQSGIGKLFPLPAPQVGTPKLSPTAQRYLKSRRR